jgi:hypothetical protein
LPLTEKQAKLLSVRPHTQISPYVEMCCLRVSANVSYQNARDDVEFLTGIKIASKTQQRLVHRQKFEPKTMDEPVKELSVDGGKVRLRTAKGAACIWRDYKAINLDNNSVEAFFQDNDALINWVNQQHLDVAVTCLGDGHDGIWNIISRIGKDSQRIEILDWYHLVENLGKIGGSNQRLEQAKSLLWSGKVAEAKALFSEDNSQAAKNFCNYLVKHQHRIVNYQYYQAEEICSIGSGAVESAVKQIGRRIKISGAQWLPENVPQVLAHRCAYLNGLFTI